MNSKITRRTFVAGASAVLLLMGFNELAWSAEVALPADAQKLGASVKAMGPAPKPQRIAILSYQGSSFWNLQDEGIKAVQAYLKPLGTTVDYVQLGTTLTAEIMVAGIDAALAKQYQGIAAVTIFDGTVGKVNEAVKASVPVIAYIADSGQRSQRTSALGTQAYEAGKIAGRFMAKQLDGKGKIAVITGYFGATQHNERMNGALDLLKKEYPGIKIVGPFENKDDLATAYAQASSAMSSNPDLNIIYVTANGSESAAKAVGDAKATGKVGIVGYDDLPEKQKYKEAGEVLALIDQYPARQAFDSAVMLHNIIGFGTKYPSEVVIPAGVAYGKGAKR